MAASTSFKQECPSCEALVPIRDPKLVGKKIECPKCKFKFVVKEPPPPEDKDDDQEEGITSRPSKKPKSSSKVTDKKPNKATTKKSKSADADDGPDIKKKKKKGGSNMLVVGGGLAVVALAALGVGGYFMFRSPSPPKPRSNPGQGVGQQNPLGASNPGTTNPNNTVVKKEENPDLIEPTNLLPKEATTVFSVNLAALRKSGVWKAAMQTPGAFSEKRFAEVFGFPLQSDGKIEARIVTALNVKENWVFSVVRTVPEIKETDLKTRLKLIPQDPINERRYYLIGGQFDALGNLLIKANQPRDTFAVHVMDAHTLIFADVAPLKKYLQDKAQPAATGKYQSLNTELKDVLERVDRSDAPAVVCMAGDVTLLFNAARPILGNVVKQGAQQLAPLIKGMMPLPVADLDKFVSSYSSDPLPAIEKVETLLREEGQKVAVGLTAFDLEQKKFALVVAVGMKNDKTAEQWHTTYIKPVLDLWATALNPTVQPMGMGQTPTKKDVPITVALAGKILTGTFMTTLKPAELSPLSADFGKLMVQARSEADLASTAPRYHQLAAALMAYVNKTGHFPRGTAERKGAERDADFRWVENRVSWMAALLPYLPEVSYDGVVVDPDKEWFAGENLAIAKMVVPHFVVRSREVSFRTADQFGVTHFVGMAGVGLNAARYRTDDKEAEDKIGIFGYERVTKKDALKDHADKVIALIQVPPEYRTPWLAGGGATVRGVSDDKKGVVQPFVCAEYKGEPGTFAIMADGKVRFISETIDPELFRAMCTIKGPDPKKYAKFNDLVPEVPNDAAPLPAGDKPMSK